MLRCVKTNFVCAFTLFFAFIAMMGEGLHAIPGVGHSCQQSIKCISLHTTTADNDCCTQCFPSFTFSDHSSDVESDADDCAVCKFFSLSKPCLFTNHLESDSIQLSEQLPVYCLVFKSRFIDTYHSRAPPCVIS